MTDSLFLPCNFELFRKMTCSASKLDTAQSYTCCHLCGDAFLLLSNASVELLTDREHPEIAENLFGVGVVSAFSNRLATTNNDMLSTFDAVKVKAIGLSVETNNLCGGVMDRFLLPLRDFEKLKNCRWT